MFWLVVVSACDYEVVDEIIVCVSSQHKLNFCAGRV